MSKTYLTKATEMLCVALESVKTFVITSASGNLRIYFQDYFMPFMRELTKQFDFVETEGLGSEMYIRVDKLPSFKESYDSIEEARESLAIMNIAVDSCFHQAMFEQVKDIIRQQERCYIRLDTLGEQIEALNKKEQQLKEQTV